MGSESATPLSGVARERAALVELRGIVKRFGSSVVVNNVSFSCKPGEVVLLLGANGAGKSTLLRIIANLVRADRGVVQHDASTRVGYAGHYTCLYSKLSVRANLSLYAAILGIDSTGLQRMLTAWGLNDAQHKSVAEVSRGVQSRASLARALMGEPELLVLDEPSSNLDEASAETLCEVIRAQASRAGASIIATHDLARLQSVATRVIVLERGAVIADSNVTGGDAAIESVVARYRMRNR